MNGNDLLVFEQDHEEKLTEDFKKKHSTLWDDFVNDEYVNHHADHYDRMREIELDRKCDIRRIEDD